MPTNITTIRNGLYSLLATCGPYSATQVSTCDYRVIENNSGCAILMHYDGEESEVITYDGQSGIPTELYNISFTGECFVQFTGDPTKFLADVYQARDDIKTTFRKDYSLMGSACHAYVNKFKFDIEKGFEMGGRDWGVLEFSVIVRDM